MLGRRLLLFVLVLLLAPDAHAQQQPGESVYALPKGTEPSAFALASDGAVWTSDDYGGVTRLSPTGGTREFLARDDPPDDVVAGPSGSVWISSTGGVLQVGPGGRVVPLSTVDGG